jgi:hypothetical protein
LSKGRLVYDSRAWVKTSIPVEALISGDMLTVSRGSSKAMVGLKKGWEIPVFTFMSRISRTETGVVSLPVPDVVGRTSKGLSGPGTGLAWPIGLFTYSMTGAGYVISRLTALVVSIMLPPPTAT